MVSNVTAEAIFSVRYNGAPRDPLERDRLIVSFMSYTGRKSARSLFSDDSSIDKVYTVFLYILFQFLKHNCSNGLVQWFVPLATQSSLPELLLRVRV